MSELETTQRQKPEPEGLGGWLILVGILLVVIPINPLLFIVRFFVFRRLDYPKPETVKYVLMPKVELVEIVTGGLMSLNFLMVGLFVYLLVLFFGRKNHFPEMFNRILLAYLALMVASGLAGVWVLPRADYAISDFVKQVVRAAITALIFCQYMLASRRVKNTFVN